ncbi:hypothetical protein ANAPH2_01061 [Anaplasma phagocytophilum]|nr:hypothetical protein ANAPH2_01061 [Anaplasma phagocytophilum]
MQTTKSLGFQPVIIFGVWVIPDHADHARKSFTIMVTVYQEGFQEQMKVMVPGTRKYGTWCSCNITGTNRVSYISCLEGV